MRRLGLSLSITGILLFVIFATFQPIAVFPSLASKILKVVPKSQAKVFKNEMREVAKLTADTPELGQKIIKRADEYLLMDPSAEMALVHKGLALFAKGNQSTARRLLELSQDRNPRNPFAAHGLFYVTLTQNDLDAAIKQLDLLFRIGKTQTEQYLIYLSQISEDPTTREAILSELSEHPAWGDQFVKTKVAQSNDFDELITFVAGWTRSFDKPQKTLAVQERLLKKMLDAQDYEAVTRFKSSLADSLAPSDSIIYDNKFQSHFAPRPLTWRLVKTGQDYAEMSENGGLNVGGKGAKKKVLASQLFFLPDEEENFDLKVSVRGRFSDKQNRFRWQIQCVPSGAVIAYIDIRQLYNRAQVLKTTFQKPKQGCEAQTIWLVGLQGNKLNRVRMDVDKVEITPTSAVVSGEKK